MATTLPRPSPAGDTGPDAPAARAPRDAIGWLEDVGRADGARVGGRRGLDVGAP
jgi:hypothetical protein